MSVFSDEDLRRLKAKEGYWKTTVNMNDGQSESWGFVDGDKIDALLARMEAAEATLLSCRRYQYDDGMVIVEGPAVKLYEAWRKAAGK